MSRRISLWPIRSHSVANIRAADQLRKFIFKTFRPPRPEPASANSHRASHPLRRPSLPPQPIRHRRIMDDELPPILIKIEEKSKLDTVELPPGQGIQHKLPSLYLERETVMDNRRHDL